MAKANFVETKKAIDDITSAIDLQIEKADQLNVKVIALNANYAKLPSEYLKTQKEIAQSNEDISKSEKKIQDALERTRLSEIKLQQDREKAFDKYEANLKKQEVLQEKNRQSELRTQQQREKAVDAYAKQSARELEAVKRVSGLYNQTQIQIKKLTEVYNDLATKKALGLKLSKDEEFQLYQLTEQLNRYRGTLKKVDSDVQLNQRTVGDYKSVFQDAVGAGNAFTNLLSNIFSKVRILAYVLPGIGIAGIFSLALDPLFKFLGGLKFIQEAFGLETAAIKAAKKALEEKTKAEAEQNKEIASTISAEQNKARILFENVKNEKIGMADRIKNFNELQEKYKKYLGDLTLQKALAGDTAEAEARLNDALAKRGLALAIQSLLQKNAEKQIEQELKYGTALKESTDASNLYDKAQEGAIKTSGNLRAVREDELDNLTNLKKTEVANSETSKNLNKQTTIQIYGMAQARAKALVPIKEEEKALLNLYKAYAPYLDFSEKDKKTKKEKLALTFSAIKSEYELQKAIIQRQMAEIGDRMNNEKSTLDARLKARQEFSKKSIELLDLEIKEENALLLEKYNDDLNKNNLAYKNKELSFKQYSENIQILNERLNNETQTAQSRNSVKFNELLNQDLAFYKKIEEEKQKFSQATAKMITDLEIKKFKAIVDNAHGEEYTLTVRQKAFEQIIKLQRAELDLAKIRELANAKSDEEIANIIQKYKDLNYEIDNLESPLFKAQQATETWIKTMANGELEKALSNIGVSSAKLFMDLDENGQSSFDKLLEGADTLKEKFAVTFQAIGDVAQDTFNKIFELSNENFQNQYDNLEREKEVALMFAGESATARAEIERQTEERRRQIQKREFEAKKQQAKFNIAIDTAQALVAQLAATPLPFGTGFLLLIAAIGAAQLALVSSQQAPAYEFGTDNHIGGNMIINDQKGSNYKEIVETPDGKKRIYEGRNVKVNAPKGTKVYTASETMDYLMFNDNLNNILTGNGIGSPVIEVKNNGISDSQVNKIVSAIENKSEFSQLITNGDLKTVVRKGNQEIEITNRRINGIGKRV